MPEHLQLTLKQADWAIEASESTQKKKKIIGAGRGKLGRVCPKVSSSKDICDRDLNC